MHNHPRAGGDVGSGLGRLLAGDAAADRIEVETGILGGFEGSAKVFAEEGWDFDSSFFDGEDDGAAQPLPASTGRAGDLRFQ